MDPLEIQALKKFMNTFVLKTHPYVAKYEIRERYDNWSEKDVIDIDYYIYRTTNINNEEVGDLAGKTTIVAKMLGIDRQVNVMLKFIDK